MTGGVGAGRGAGTGSGVGIGGGVGAGGAVAGAGIGAGGAGVGALGFAGAAHVMDSPLLFALADFGFMINLFNLIPLGMMDGGKCTY